jgi:DNA-binding LacI/PurR family transcriptional regulator
MDDDGRPTLRDVARAAHVSHQTVFNVVHGRGRASPSTRLRVHAAIEALGYHPNAAANNLRTRRSNRIAYPMTTGLLGPRNTIMLEFVQALTAAAGQRSQHLLLSANDGAPSYDVLDLARSGTVDAIVLPTVLPSDPRVADLARHRIPFASFGRTAPTMPQSWVDIDGRTGVGDLTRRIIEIGHARVAFLGYAPQGDWDRDRQRGYQDAMSAAGLPAIIATPAVEAQSVQRAIDGLLDASPAPTAILCGSDVLAAAVYSVAAVRGIQIGHDLAVTGFDGSFIGRMLTPALTTLAIPLTRVAQRLIDRALRELTEPNQEPGEILVPELIVGASA